MHIIINGLYNISEKTTDHNWKEDAMEIMRTGSCNSAGRVVVQCQ